MEVVENIFKEEEHSHKIEMEHQVEGEENTHQNTHQNKGTLEWEIMGRIIEKVQSLAR